MWIIRWVIAVLVIIFIIGFAVQNTEQEVTVTFLNWESGEMQLWVVMYIAFAAGIFTWLVISIFHAISLRAENAALKKEVVKLKEELDRLRNLSVEESLSSLGIHESRINDKEA